VAGDPPSYDRVSRDRLGKRDARLHGPRMKEICIPPPFSLNCDLNTAVRRRKLPTTDVEWREARISLKALATEIDRS
jgi:hypothetical protein